MVPPRKANAKRLRSAVQAVLEEDSYRREARKIQAAMSEIDGLDRAADIIEDVLKIRMHAGAEAPTRA